MISLFFAPPRCSAPFSRAALAAAGCLSAACASINPTLTAARVLPAGRVTFDVGSAYSAPVVAPVLWDARAAGSRIASGSGSSSDRDALTRGAAAFGATPPGMGVYLAGRVGLGHETEAQLALAGRTVRAGARHVVWHDTTGDWSLSLGGQARVAFLPLLMDGTVQTLTVSSSQLYGGDVSMLFGRTNSDLYDFVIGLRAGYTHGEATMSLASVNSGPFGATLDRFDAALTLGVRVGLGHVSGMIEIEALAGYYRASAATATRLDASGGIFSLVPAAALSLNF